MLLRLFATYLAPYKRPIAGIIALQPVATITLREDAVDANLILVVEEGRIVERGTHSELVARAGAYHGLHNAQFTG